MFNMSWEYDNVGIYQMILDGRDGIHKNWTLKELMIDGIRNNFLTLKDASISWRHDREVVLAGVKRDGLALQFASDALRDDREIVLEAIKNNGSALQFASDTLKEDEELKNISLRFGPLLRVARKSSDKAKTLSTTIMKQKYQDFLFKFTTDDHLSCEPVMGCESILNELLYEITEEELIAYAESFEDRCLLGFGFFDCADMVAEKNKEKFLALTWVMFGDQQDDSKTDGNHPWMGLFNPIEPYQHPDCRYSAWFREGVIRHELYLTSMGWTYNYGWWKDFSHFLNELFEFQTKEFIVSFLEELGEKLDKVALEEYGEKLDKIAPLNIHIGLEKSQILEVFKSWAGDDLKLFDTEIDWDE